MDMGKLNDFRSHCTKCEAFDQCLKNAIKDFDTKCIYFGLMKEWVTDTYSPIVMECWGCKHIEIRIQDPFLIYPCDSCKRSHRIDYFEPETSE